LEGNFREVKNSPDISSGSVVVEKLKIIKEFLGFLMENKKWWLVPIILVLLILSFLILFSEGSALAPFIYTLF
jgi:hypothetical protein